MSLTGSIYSLLGGAGVAGVWLYCFLQGQIFTKKHMEDKEDQIRELKEALKLANQRADAQAQRAESATEAANTSNLLLAGIRKEISTSVAEK